MPFDQGSVTCRICRLPEKVPADALDRFASNAASSLENVKQEPAYGWVSGRHLLETRIDEETASLAGYIHLSLRQAQKKIPTSLFNAECRMAELAELEDKGKNRLSRKEKQRIKQEVTEKLLPDMPPQLSAMPFVIDQNDDLLYVGVSSDTQLDLFIKHFRNTVGIEPVPLTPETAAQDLAAVDPDSVPQLNFSPEVEDASATGTLGQNFLTWLWVYQEENGGKLPPSQLGTFSLLIDGPLVFMAEGEGALESNVKKGAPTLSAEAKAALTVGKKLKKAKMFLGREGSEVWSANIDADGFTFKGLRLPDGEALDRAGIFEERMTNLHIFQTVFFNLFKRFISETSDPPKVSEFQEKAKEWVRKREGR